MAAAAREPDSVRWSLKHTSTDWKVHWSQSALVPLPYDGSPTPPTPPSEVFRSTSGLSGSLDSLPADVGGKLSTPPHRMSHRSIELAIFGDRGHTPGGSKWDQSTTEEIYVNALNYSI